MAEKKDFSGLCLGGPLDGKWVDHYTPHYKAIIAQHINFDVLNPENTAVNIDSTVFTYSFFRMVDLGFWIPLALRNGGMYECRHYHEPYEFIVKRLMANYRPEGF